MSKEDGMFKITKVSIFLFVFAFFISCKSQADKDYDELQKMINSDRCSDAIQFASKAIEKYPNDARFYYYRGYCYYENNNLYNAKLDFANCIRIDPNFAAGYYGLAIVFGVEEQYDLAEKYYNKAIEMAPNKIRKSSYISNLSSLFSRKKDYKKAIETIKKAIELKDKGDSYFNLGRYLFLDGQKQEAEKTWLKAVNEKKFTQIRFKHMTYAVLADYYFQEKDYKKSLENIEKAIELAPDNNLYIRFYNRIKLLAK